MRACAGADRVRAAARVPAGLASINARQAHFLRLPTCGQRWQALPSTGGAAGPTAEPQLLEMAVALGGPGPTIPRRGQGGRGGGGGGEGRKARGAPVPGRAARACTPYAAMKRCATAAEVPGPTVAAEAPHPGPKELLMARRVHPPSKTHKHTRLSGVD